jgi:hypothetical protein
MTDNEALLERFTPDQTTLHDQERINRPSDHVPRNYHQHQSDRAAEHDRLEHELGVEFHSAERMTAFNGIDHIHTPGDEG